jgi:hypothetical protein
MLNPMLPERKVRWAVGLPRLGQTRIPCQVVVFTGLASYFEVRP